jgi:hypothetical protein
LGVRTRTQVAAMAHGHGPPPEIRSD